MHHHYYAGGVQKAAPIPYPGDGPIDAPDDNAAAEEMAQRIHNANREGKASADAENLMALAAVAGRVEQHQEQLGDVVEVLEELGQEQQGLAQQVARLEGQVQAIPAPDLQQQQELAQEVLTLEVRARNETQGGLAAIRAEREAAAAEYQQLSNLLSEQVSTATSWRGEMEQRIAISTGEAALSALRPMLTWWKKVKPLLEGLRGISRVWQEKPGEFLFEASPAVPGAAEPIVAKLAGLRGERGYRGAQGSSQAVGGGSGGGSPASRVIGATCEVRLDASRETQIRHLNLTNPVTLKGDGDLRVKLVSIGNPDQWSSFTLSSAAAIAAAPTQESALTIGPDFSGVGGEVPVSVRVVRRPDGVLEIYATAGVDCTWTSTVSAVTEV